MADSLRKRVDRFVHLVADCTTVEQIVLALHEAVMPDAFVLGIWGFPHGVLDGHCLRYPIWVHPDLQAFLWDYWPLFDKNHLSYLSRYSLAIKRDVLLSEARHACKADEGAALARPGAKSPRHAGGPICADHVYVGA